MCIDTNHHVRNDTHRHPRGTSARTSVRPEGTGSRHQALTKKPAQFTMRVCAGHDPQLIAKAPSRRHPIDAKLYDPEILVGINGPEDVEE